MKKLGISRNEKVRKLTAFTIMTTLVISSSSLMISSAIPSPSSFFGTPTKADQNLLERRTSKPELYEPDSILSANEQTWEDMDTDSSSGTPAETFVSESNLTGITVISNIYGFWKGNVSLNGTNYNTLDLPAAALKSIEGQPQVPRLAFTVEVPHDVDITTEILSSSSLSIGDYNIVPAQIATVGLKSATVYPFVKNITTYSTNSMYPQLTHTISGELSSSPMILRGRRLVQVTLHPIQFNPISGQLNAYTQFEIRIIYDHPSQIEPVDAALYSKAFESLYQRIILNYQEWTVLSLATSTTSIITSPTTATSDTSSASESSSSFLDYSSGKSFMTADYPNNDEAEYLIIAYDDFENQAQILADWKTRKGIFTKVMLTSDERIYGERSEVYESLKHNLPDGYNIDNLENERISKLKNFIKDDVMHWSLVPTYILLFGDVNHIPSDYSITHTAWFPSDPPVYPPHLYHGDGDKGRIPTDVTYFCVEEEDYLPDIMHGRISVEDEDDAKYIVNKILIYEQQPYEHATFYNDILLSAYFDDYIDPECPNEIRSDGIEDEPFISTTEAIYNDLHLQYTFHKSYTMDTSATPTTLFDGSSVSSMSWSSSDRPWIADNTDIVENIIEGRFLVYHIDHGTSVNFWWNDWESAPGRPQQRGEFDGWGAPDFRTAQFDQLKFTEDDRGMYPLVLSMDCMTGWFDGETDGLFDWYGLYDQGYTGPGGDLYDTERLTDSFAEEIIRIENGGAIAAIAPTRISYNKMSSNLMLGITNAFWPGIVDVSYPEDIVPPVYNLGLALYCGKYYIENAVAFDAEDIRLRKGDITMLEYHLFGDPETPLWTEAPTTLAAEHAIASCIGGLIQFTVTVSDENGAVEGAKVCLYKQNEVFAIENTSHNGQAMFQVEPLTTGNMQVTVTKQNSKPYLGDIEILPIFCPILSIVLILVPSLIIVVIVVIFVIKKKK